MRLIPQTLIPQFLRPKAPPQAVSLFEAAMAASRDPRFYAEFGLPDTLQGRMEVLMLHLAALHRRLSPVEPHGMALWRDTLDYAMSEIERALRDVGVGDVTVPKRMRKIAEAFYGRAKAYGAALDGARDNDALAAALARNAYGETPPDGDEAQRLARHARAIAEALVGQPDTAFLAGTVVFPDPAPLTDERADDDMPAHV